VALRPEAMLTIRPEQLEVFQPIAEAAFERRVTTYLRENHDDTIVVLPTGEHEVKDLDDETLLKMVCTGIARSRSYGMTWESSITAFVVLMFTIAPNFDAHPLINRALRDDKVEPNARVEEMWDRTTEENWQTAKDSYDAGAWNLGREGE
jgi:hypothetical protein